VRERKFMNAKRGRLKRCSFFAEKLARFLGSKRRGGYAWKWVLMRGEKQAHAHTRE